jgi:hypothetical protein
MEDFSNDLKLEIGDMLSRPLSLAPCARQLMLSRQLNARTRCRARPLMLTSPLHARSRCCLRDPVIACAPVPRAPVDACAPASNPSFARPFLLRASSLRASVYAYARSRSRPRTRSARAPSNINNQETLQPTTTPLSLCPENAHPVHEHEKRNPTRTPTPTLTPTLKTFKICKRSHAIFKIVSIFATPQDNLSRPTWRLELQIKKSEKTLAAIE